MMKSLLLLSLLAITLTPDALADDKPNQKAYDSFYQGCVSNMPPNFPQAQLFQQYCSCSAQKTLSNMTEQQLAQVGMSGVDTATLETLKAAISSCMPILKMPTQTAAPSGQ